jgi:hypothetical protein
MKWNGRYYRPGQGIPVYPKKQESITELLKPLGEKTNRGNVWIPVLNQPINILKEETSAPVSSPTPTPSSTTTPTPTLTPSPTPTPSSAGAFTPSSLGDLQIWFDASDSGTLTTVTEGSDTFVTEWQSKGLLTYPISAETTNRRPLFITTGGDGTKDAVYFQNTGTTREILFNRGTTNMPTTSGFTMFWAGRYAGSPALSGAVPTNPYPIALWNSNYTALNPAEALQLGFRYMIDRQPLNSGNTTAYQSQYEVNYANNVNYLDSSTYVLNGFSMDYTQNIPTVQPLSTTVYEGNYYKSTSNTSGYTSNFSTQGKNLNSFGMMGYKLATTYTQSSTQNQPWEIFEVLVYNKPISSSDFAQVETYLRNKWGISYSTTGKAVIDIDFTPGLQFSATGFNDLVISGGTSSTLQWAGTWTNVDDKTIISASTTYYIFTERGAGASSPAYDFELFDGLGNSITGATCFSATTIASAIPISLSAGTYTLTGRTRYDC